MLPLSPPILLTSQRCVGESEEYNVEAKEAKQTLLPPPATTMKTIMLTPIQPLFPSLPLLSSGICEPSLFCFFVSAWTQHSVAVNFLSAMNQTPPSISIATMTTGKFDPDELTYMFYYTDAYTSLLNPNPLPSIECRHSLHRERGRIRRGGWIVGFRCEFLPEVCASMSEVVSSWRLGMGIVLCLRDFLVLVIHAEYLTRVQCDT